MEIDEANEIIAEYMGYTRFAEGWNTNNKGDGNYWVHLDWFMSLSNLVPVWEDLRICDITYEYVPYDRIGWFCSIDDITYPCAKTDIKLGLSLEEASLVATAKCILSLDKE